MKSKPLPLKILIVAIILVIIFVIIYKSSQPDGNLHLIFCDVGQGDGILIKTPKGSQIIIDGGYNNKMHDCLESNISVFDRTIELAMTSHLHADHIGGLVPIAKNYNISKLVQNKINYTTPEVEEFEAMMNFQKEKSQKLEIWSGDSLKLEDLTIDIFWPDKNAWNRANGNWEAYLNDFNDSSVVALITYKNFQCLLTGDVGLKILDSIVETQQFKVKIKSDSIKVLKYPHHGSKDGLSHKTLEIFKKSPAVISVGDKNKYGHPHKESLMALEQYRLPIFRTDIEGTIHFSTDGHTLWKSEN